MFVGYDNPSKSYRVWNPGVNKIEVARDVIFLLEVSMATLDVGDAEKNVNENVDEFDGESDGDADADTDGHDTLNQSIRRGELCDLNDRNVVERRLRDRHTIAAARKLTYLASADHTSMLAISDELRTYEQAIESDEHQQWDAMNEEYDSLIENRTWILVNPPEDQKVIDNRWDFKLKQNPDGSIDRRTNAFATIRGENEIPNQPNQPIGYNDGSGRVCKLSKSRGRESHFTSH